ncbi:cyclically-permuted mutarotase family protein [Arenibacter nanhaiticus]|uniref:Cyclically-permuted mutarotase family protein n=1 Tax=Arenibacter nanhaiticus TaxID=558155 RepID=A0A1M6GBZ6_9FLAO|nr:sodium/solute symporter [Arenibacter nanhaiticus]SHJ07437.1 cyclically-permuted mutarotase family protein [Arenibacter nanhaiticus]
MKVTRILYSLVITILFSSFLFGQEASKIQINNVPSLPAEVSGEVSLGYAGMMGGIHKDIVIVGGGANFPSGLPWKGGAKKWHQSIYILENNTWRLSSEKLPMPLGYGASVSTEDGVLIIGGDNKELVSDKVFLLAYNSDKKDIDIIDYPNLPEPLAYTTAVLVDDYVYVAGGMNKEASTNSFYRLDVSKKGSWEKLKDFPGAPRAVHAMAVQETSNSKNIFLIGGRNQVKGQKSQALTSYLSYDLQKKNWIEEGDLMIDGKARVLMGATAESSGSMGILVYGGSDEILFDQLESLALKINAEENDSIAQSLIAKRDNILNNHPGFSKEVIAYNSITKKWFVYDTLAIKIPVTTLGIKEADDILLVSGEVSPGIRTPKVYSLKVFEATHAFGALNYGVLVLYLLISLLIGVYFARKQKSTDDYFIGGGRIPWWASGLSVFGTLLSAITFMAIPAKAFITDWSFFLLNIAAIAITPVIAFIFIPFFNKLHISTAYEYLERRFNYLARAIGSISFILFQLGRIGIVLLLPSLAISIVTGISVETCILLMGLLCVLYTTFGGIEAVIWTDVLQVVVLMGGSIVAIVWVLLHTEMPFNDMITYVSDQEKFNIVNFDLNFTDSTFWVVFIGGLASAMVTQGTDQTIVQRYLTSSSIKDSQKTLYTNAIMTLPATIIFFGIGSLLFIYYSEMPEHLSPAISNNDSLFPWYIVKELPVGVSGLLIAGIFSAAMSSISSSLNSVSTAFCNDLYKRYNPTIGDVKLLKVARIATVIVGVIGVILALWMANSNIKSLWDQFYRFLGLFTGGLGGMFLLGMLTKRANATGTLIGLVLSGILLWYISVYTPINFLMYSLIGVASCFGFGYLFSLIFKNKEQ